LAAVFELPPFLAAVVPVLTVVFARLEDLRVVFDFVVVLVEAVLDFFGAAVSAAPYSNVDASARSATSRKIKYPR
jgi:hypothetical protein